MKRRTPRWVVTTLFFCAALAVIAGAFLATPFIEADRHTLATKSIPSDSLKSQPALVYALKRYEIGGARYKWGHNDCSTFVTDYLRALARPAYPRLTTRDLYEPSAMSWNGFLPTTQKELKPGDIIVFRYTGRYKTLQGHTGIVVRHAKDLYVVHNSLSYGGVQFEELQSFLTRANRVADSGPKGKMVRYFTPDS